MFGKLRTMLWTVSIVAVTCRGAFAQQALDFVETDDRVVIANYSGFPQTAVTVEFWINTSDTSREGGILSFAAAGGSANEFVISDPDNLQVSIRGVGNGIGPSVADGQWHHVAVTWNNADGKVKMFVDGIGHDLITIAQGAVLASNGTLVLGDVQGSQGGGFQESKALIGQLDDVRVWSSVISPQDIAARECDHLVGNESNLVSYWPADALLDLGVGNAGANDVEDIAGANHGDAQNGLALISNDGDADTVSDACDVCPGMDDLGPDTDGDGVPDACDICPGGDDVTDGDGDGIPNGCDTAVVHNLTQMTDHYGLQEAINAAVDGDVIEAEPQTYFEGINFAGKSITLRSQSGDPADTIIDGQMFDPAQQISLVTFASGEDAAASFAGFSLVNNHSVGDGGAMYIRNASSPTINNCVFRNNQARIGGALRVRGGHPVISGCLFEDNVANDPNENGAAAGGGAHITGSAELHNCVFRRNAGPDIPWEGQTPYGEFGGGALQTEGGVLIDHCTFEDNTAYAGAAINNFLAGPTIENCTFSNNVSAYDGEVFLGDGSRNTSFSNCSFNGGSWGVRTTQSGSNSLVFTDCYFTGYDIGMYLFDSSATISNCTFDANATGLQLTLVTHDGNYQVQGCTFSNNTDHAIYNGSSRGVISNCLFTNNYATQGGAIYNRGDSFIRVHAITQCVFRNNSANQGGAIHIGTNYAGTITDCLFEGNSAAHSGGGMDIADVHESFRLSRCRFMNNTVDPNGVFGGGGLMVFADDLPIDNCVFSHNSARIGGGLNCTSGSATATNCTFVGNTAEQGGGLGAMLVGTINLRNSICVNNVDASPGGETSQVYVDNSDFDTVDIAFSNVQGGYAGVGNIDADPLFINADGLDGMPGTIDDDLRLSPGSPCIDAGNNALVPVDATIDMAGNERFVDNPNQADCAQAPGQCGMSPVVDMGAYEAPFLAFDFDGDGDVDLSDFSAFSLCFAGANNPPAASCPAGLDADFDDDGDVDLGDFSAFSLAFTGPQ